MPSISGNEQKKFSTQSTYGQFFQAAVANEQYIPQTAEAIKQLTEYQEEVNNYQQIRDKIKYLLDKGTLTPAGQTKAISRLQAVEDNLAHHQSKLASLINSHPALQAHFSSQTSLNTQ